MKAGAKRNALKEHDQAIRFLVRQRLDQRRVDKREDRHAGTKSKGEDQNGCDRETEILSQLTQCESQILDAVVDQFHAAFEMEPLTSSLRIAKVGTRLSIA